MPQPWERTPPPDAGDADASTLYAAVGEALTEWEKVEEELWRLFSLLVGQELPSLPAERAYGSIISFQQRRIMLEKAGEAYFFLHPEEKIESLFIDALKYADGFSGRRNDIAMGR